MEFIQYLDRVEIEIIRMVEKAGYSIEENTPLCLLSENYVGFFKKREKKIIICTENAKRREGYTLLSKIEVNRFKKTAKHIKKALRHESVHVAQECNNGNLLDMKEILSMNPAKIEALNGSIKISGEKEKEKEKQAYILEDRPKQVKKELKKYCL
tara:strand:+ start:712 stop:1176 length:465 start_codon:yes stop_codon:yes gene_type:complete